MRRKGRKQKSGIGKGGGIDDWEGESEVEGLRILNEREMNSLNQRIPGLRRQDVKTHTIRQHFYPEGGWGWVICACACSIHALTSGLQLSFGVFHLEMIRHFGQEDTWDAMWVGSVSLSTSHATTPFVVALCRRKSTRLSAVIGGLVMALACLFTSFAQKFHQLYFSYGLMLGIGIGFARETANLMIGQYFKRRREFAEVIVQSGTGIGLAAFPSFFQGALRALGWRLGLQAATGILFLSFILGIFYRPASLYHPQRRAIIHLKIQKRNVKDKRKSAQKPSYWDFSLLGARPLQILLLSNFISGFGIYTPLFHLRSHTCLVSRKFLHQTLLFAVGLSMAAICGVEGYHGYSLTMWVYGICLGGASYTSRMLTYEQVRAKKFARAWGFIQISSALPLLIGIPITGYLNRGSEKGGYYFSFVSVLLSALSLIGLSFIRSEGLERRESSTFRAEARARQGEDDEDDEVPKNQLACISEEVPHMMNLDYAVSCNKVTDFLLYNDFDERYSSSIGPGPQSTHSHLGIITSNSVKKSRRRFPNGFSYSEPDAINRLGGGRKSPELTWEKQVPDKGAVVVEEITTTV
ncbi:unnamed protein product [Darwinula stevensoni]|uniref:Monocarboxylate transporter n=1 Tax=Darwinula stevensoni TaxID=69355 RepID=A0A7R9AAK5_9CRUS|nr:unnamed protein product [Darwinula stevensoni]CAG0898552.1 unnamed protein product [Darwinula stevensoni]